MLNTFTSRALTVIALSAFALASAHATTPTKKPVKAKARTATMAKAAPAAVVPAAAVAALSVEQMSIAQIVHTGSMRCELGQNVSVTPSARTQGAFDVKIGGNSYDTVPVLSKTGAIRLEDTRRGIVYMQLANKSMLLDERNGRRLADECMSDQQKVVAERMRTEPAQSVLDAPKK